MSLVSGPQTKVLCLVSSVCNNNESTMPRLALAHACKIAEQESSTPLLKRRSFAYALSPALEHCFTALRPSHIFSKL